MKRLLPYALVIFTMAFGLVFAGQAGAQDRGYWIAYHSPSTGQMMECWTPSPESRQCLNARPARSQPGPSRVVSRPTAEVDCHCQTTRQAPVTVYRTEPQRRYEEPRYEQRYQQPAPQRRYDPPPPQPRYEQRRQEPVYQTERRDYNHTSYDVFPRYGTVVPGFRISHTRGNETYTIMSNDRDFRLRGRIEMNDRTQNRNGYGNGYGNSYGYPYYNNYQYNQPWWTPWP